MMLRLRSKLVLLVLVAAFAACRDVPIDDERQDQRLIPPRGVIRGTVTYAGPRPCSRDGHIVGNAIVLVFDRRNPPPPNGVATGAVNFVAVPGDALFANEPRSTGSALYCPTDPTPITVSASFSVAPLDAGSYQLSSFYDRQGHFWPTFKYRNQPESGDLGGGYIDLEDARKNATNPNYSPLYLPVDVGYPNGDPSPGTVPDYTMPTNGYVADNIPVTIGSVIPFTRPYFHPEGADVIGTPQTSDANTNGDPLLVPIVAMTQDIQVLAAPTTPSAQTLTAYQASFRSVKLVWGVADSEAATAIDEKQPFGLQLPPGPPAGKGGLVVWKRGVSVPENAALPALWPRVFFVKLADDPKHENDPQSLVVQGTAQESIVTGRQQGPIVVMEGIVLDRDAIALTAGAQASPNTNALRDHLTVLLRPAVLCFDPRRVDFGALLVTPHFTGRSADANETGDKPLFDAAAVSKQAGVREVRQGCLPKGRFAISTVYPTGQAWTVPNEMGSCAQSEGATQTGSSPSCATKPRPVLLSQGGRAVLEIVAPADAATCTDNPVPKECTSL